MNWHSPRLKAGDSWFDEHCAATVAASSYTFSPSVTSRVSHGSFILFTPFPVLFAGCSFTMSLLECSCLYYTILICRTQGKTNVRLPPDALYIPSPKGLGFTAHLIRPSLATSNFVQKNVLSFTAFPRQHCDLMKDPVSRVERHLQKGFSFLDSIRGHIRLETLRSHERLSLPYQKARDRQISHWSHERPVSKRLQSHERSEKNTT